MKQRGRPVRGAVAGLFLGIFVALDLVIFGVLALDADVLALLPLLGAVAGVALGATAPIGRRAGTEEPGRTRPAGRSRVGPRIT